MSRLKSTLAASAATIVGRSAACSGRHRQVTAARGAKRASRQVLAGEHVAQLLGRIPGVDEARVERREAEAQQVGAAVAASLRGSPARKSPITPRSISACITG